MAADNISIIAFGSFALCALFTSALKKLSLTYNLLSSKGIPLIGGLAIGLSFIPISLFCAGPAGSLMGIIAPSSIMLIFGLVDDWREFSVFPKFLLQAASTALLVFLGIRTHIAYLGDTLNIIITFIWVLGITNAFNHLDVMDGVAAGIALLVTASFCAVAFLNKDITTLRLCLGLSGAIIGFLIYNFPPAKVYMGNSGSHFLGFILAAVALIISYAPLERKIALFSPILILGLPIFDSLFLILMRLRQGRPVFKKKR